MICPYCKYDNFEGIRFCTSCGALLPNPEEPKAEDSAAEEVAESADVAEQAEVAQPEAEGGAVKNSAAEVARNVAAAARNAVGAQAAKAGERAASEEPTGKLVTPIATRSQRAFSSPLPQVEPDADAIAGPEATYHQQYEPFDVHGPDSTDVMRPVASVPGQMVAEHSLDAAQIDPEADGITPIEEPRRQYEEPDTSSYVPTIIGIALGVIGLLAIVFGFRSCTSRIANAPAGSGSAVVAPAAGGEDQGSVAQGSGEQAGSEEKSEEEHKSSLPQPDVKDSIADYSWDELSQISDLITECADADKAAEVAKKYHILTDDGKITDATREIKLGTGATVQARVAGIYHDELADGGGKAGITFYVPFIASLRGMNGSPTNADGWAGSDMRAWLNSPDGIEGNLPGELRDKIAPASKMTNNTGRSVQTDSVTPTSDRVWLFSLREVCGDIAWEWAAEPGNSENFNQIANLEGSQYQLFRELGVTAGQTSNAVVNRDGNGASTHWWLRSPSLGTDDQFRYIAYDGNTTTSGEATYEIGVVFGFCV